MQHEPVSLRSEPVSPRSEIIMPVLLKMETKDIFNLSLVYPELFDEATWSLLCKSLFGASWDYYSFLPEKNQRRKFVEIARRKCFLPVSCPRSQLYLALFNNRKDIIEQCCLQHPKQAGKVVLSSFSFDRLYFNRPLYNFAQEILFGGTFQRLKLLEQKRDLPSLVPEYWEEKYSLATEDFCYGSMDNSHARVHDLLHMYILYKEEGGENIVLREDNVEFWLNMYSRSQKKAIISRMIDFAQKKDLPCKSENILCNLYSSNHLDLAEKYQTKFSLSLSKEQILASLANYYINTGDDRGLYQSLSLLEKEGKLKGGPVEDNLIVKLGLSEVNSLLKA
nr:hypothetical protein Cbor_292 [Cedratvirus borely]